MRYLPLNEQDRQAMLGAIGVGDVDALFCDVPAAAGMNKPLNLPGHQSELSVERHMASLAAQNHSASDGPFFIGGGAYYHHIPASVGHLISRGEFLTAYTPYQPEISQGTLQVLFEYQSQVVRLTGMDVANASMYDGSTGCGEAVLMAARITKRKKAILAAGLHPQYAEVVATMTAFTDDEIVNISPGPGQEMAVLIDQIDEDTSCVVVQTPDFFGGLHDLAALSAVAHEKGALVIAVVTEIVSLGAVRSPGEMGADIVVGEGQSIGNQLSFGGPYLGLFATRHKYVRQMPGRLCGETVDSEGRRGFVLTLSTREQHIRREKATSNICTNSGLCALAFSIHLTLLGEVGLRELARINHAKACRLARLLGGVAGVTVINDTWFNEFTVRLVKPAASVVEALSQRGIMAGLPVSRLLPDQEAFDDLLIVAATEMTTDQDIETYAAALSEVLA